MRYAASQSHGEWRGSEPILTPLVSVYVQTMVDLRALGDGSLLGKGWGNISFIHFESRAGEAQRETLLSP